MVQGPVTVPKNSETTVNRPTSYSGILAIAHQRKVASNTKGIYSQNSKFAGSEGEDREQEETDYEACSCAQVAYRKTQEPIPSRH